MEGQNKNESNNGGTIAKAIPREKVHKNVSRIPLRGRKFEGHVTKKFDNRATIEFSRVKLVRKYERYMKRKTKIHAKLPKSIKENIGVGDYVQIRECRPLSKILHHVVVKKLGGEIKK